MTHSFEFAINLVFCFVECCFLYGISLNFKEKEPIRAYSIKEAVFMLSVGYWCFGLFVWIFAMDNNLYVVGVGAIWSLVFCWSQLKRGIVVQCS